MIQKVAVLGGGASSLTTALRLTDEPNWQEKYDITIYQMGWRLGGKGASGRNPEIANRIEEHGLHLWFGFYDNAFDVMQKCYAEMNRPAGSPLATWQDAFKPCDLVVLEEYVFGKWEHMPIQMPRNSEVPGTRNELPTIWQYVKHILEFVKDRHIMYAQNKMQKNEVNEDEHSKWFEGLEDWWEKVKHLAEAVALDISGRLIFSALKLIDDMEHFNPDHQNKLLDFLHRILKSLWDNIERKIDEDVEVRHLWIFTDFALTTTKGIIVDGVITKGFEVINDMDLRDWLVKHGVAPITADSAIVQAIYGLVFGGYKYFSFEAGTALRGLTRLGLTYKGAVYYRMQAGMGDTVFTPLYEVLKKRGVKFKFFHKVKNLKLNAEKNSIEAIEMGMQATTVSGGEYMPTFDVLGLQCWPSHPLYDQIVEGNALKEQDINLESYWSPWQDVQNVSLQKGFDFDIVVQGISLGALPVIAKELIAANRKWADMIKNITPCATQAFQLWFNKNITEMGWKYANIQLALSGSYKEPMDTWADMSQLLVRETWPVDNTPKNVAYVCGPIQEYIDYSKWNFNDHSVPQAAVDAVKMETKKYMKEQCGHLWNNISDDKGNVNWDALVDINNAQGEKKFDSQWFRSNIDPTELYILSTTNSSKYRIKTHDGDFDNLYITGDWIDNGFNAGCVEATVMSGLQAARAILKQDFWIPGEKDMV